MKKRNDDNDATKKRIRSKKGKIKQTCGERSKQRESQKRREKEKNLSSDVRLVTKVIGFATALQSGSLGVEHCPSKKNLMKERNGKGGSCVW